MSIKQVGIIGAGTMGNGIAQVCAASGLSVALVDISDAAIQRGVDAVTGNLDRLIKKEKLTPQGKSEILGRIKASVDYAAFKDVDIVIEAATENRDLKVKILGKSMLSRRPERSFLRTPRRSRSPSSPPRSRTRSASSVFTSSTRCRCWR